MKKFVLALCAVSLFSACNNADTKTGETNAGEVSKSEVKPGDNAAKPAAQMDPAAMQKAWIDFATPGTEHQWIAKSAGTWTCDSVAQWMDPKTPATYNKATSVEKPFANGLYMEGEYTSSMMGQPMMGKSIFGYDKMKKKYVMSWVDNLGSGIVRMEGDYDAATKTLHLKGKQSDPVTATETDIRQEQKWIDDNTYVMIMYGTGHDGKEAKFMEGTFKRKK